MEPASSFVDTGVVPNPESHPIQMHSDRVPLDLLLQ